MPPAIFEYAYGAVGNRTTQTATIASPQVTNYVYDEANRLISATTLPGTGEQEFAWDDNGNLFEAGEHFYTYDQANRLTTIETDETSITYRCNGDGARLEQIVNGAPTTYAVDLAAPLVQVLVATDGNGDTRYVYGITRIGEQQSGGWLYHLTDALGSVRQLADSSGNVQLARGYTPYGEPLWMNGTASSRYAFTGEDYDPTVGLVFLRARYMQPRLGIFLARDPWSGDTMRPGSMNGFGYVEGNPISHVDPSGWWRCYPKNDGCAEWIYSALDLLRNSGDISRAFVDLFEVDNNVTYWFVVDAPDSGFVVPFLPDVDQVLITSSYLADPLPPPANHVGVFVHETVHSFRNPAERSTIFSEVEAMTIEARVLQELGDPGNIDALVYDLIRVAVEGGQVTRDLDKLAEARCILLDNYTGTSAESVYYHMALIFNYGQGWWEPCRSCGNP